MRKTLLAVSVMILAGAPAFACDELGEMRRALAQAQADAASSRRASAERAIAEAVAAQDVMGEYLSLVYFPGMFALRTDVVELTVAQGAPYQAVAAELAFLRGAPGSKIQLEPGKERTEQFAALKAFFAQSLRRAAAEIRQAGGDPKLATRLGYLSEWGVESQVQDGAKDSVQILTHQERGAILAAAAPAAAQADPRE